MQLSRATEKSSTEGGECVLRRLGGEGVAVKKHLGRLSYLLSEQGDSAAHCQSSDGMAAAAAAAGTVDISTLRAVAARGTSFSGAAAGIKSLILLAS